MNMNGQRILGTTCGILQNKMVIFFRDAIKESFWIKGRFWVKNLTIKSTYKMYDHGNRRSDFPKASQLLSFAQEVLNFIFIKGFIF